jgi:tetratricopeptide (TPR) repeat protein
MSGSLALAALLFVSSASIDRGAAVPQDAAGSTGPSLAPLQSAEFPAADWQIWGLQSRGLRARIAASRLATAPDDPATIPLLLELRRSGDALAVLRNVVTTRPGDMTRAFKALGHWTRELTAERSRPYAENLREIVAKTTQRLSTMPREEAARVARELVTVEAELAFGRTDWRSRLAAFVSEYAGTDASLLAEVDLLSDRIGPSMIDRLDAFARRHPGTEAAAKAIYQKGFHLGHNPFSFGERQRHDPTDRFFRVLDVYTELRSGRYPPSEWVEKAPSLIVEFSAYKPVFARGNVERMLRAHEELLPVLLRAYEADPSRDQLAFFIGHRMGELFKLQGDAVGGIERVFDRLERLTKDTDAVKLLRAEYYLRPNDLVIAAEDRPALRAKGRAGLEALAGTGGGFHRRKALATLARLRFEHGDHAEAGVLYRRYLEQYGGSDYAWVAALRVAQTVEALGRAAAAVPLFLQASERFRDNPLARVLGLAYAARAAEAVEEYDRALEYYRSAFEAWDGDYGPTYSLYATRPATPGEPFLRVDDAAVERDVLPERVADLKQATTTPGGALVERARWLLARGRWHDAASALTPFFARHPESPLAAGAREVSHTAQLEMALDLADTEKPGASLGAALEALKTLSNEPPDFAVCAARIALATLTFISRSKGDADALMADALRTWQALDQPTTPAGPSDVLHRDVVAIRNAVFRPRGGGVFETGRWNAFRWESAATRFFTVDPELRVKSASGEITRITVFDSFPPLDNVIFLDDERRKLLERIMLKIGGTKRRPWTQVMQTPNQPAGASLDVAAFWKKYFWTQPGHWGGWVFESYPIIDEIEFVNAERTRAAVKVTVGYSGATVQMEKKEGSWVATGLTNLWIT